MKSGYTIDHIGIAVHNIEEALTQYSNLSHQKKIQRERVESQGLEVAFLHLGEQKLEFLMPISDSSPVVKFLAKRGPGVHHIAYKVDDILEEMDRLRKEGFQLIHEAPFIGAGNKWVCFLHPKSTNGVLTELCQYLPKASEEE